MSSRIDPYLSVIIPAFNESERLGSTLASVHAYLQETPFASEVIVVDDGSGDATTELVHAHMRAMPNLKLLQFTHNQGKGWAVRAGMLNARGTHRLFMDADGSTAITHWDALEEALSAGADVVVGSRHVHGSNITVHQGVHREALGALFRGIVRMGFALPIVDTQNGFKVFTASAAERVFRRQTVHGWAFDVEVLSIAKRLGYVMQEVPITWIDDNRSRMTPAAMPRMLADLMRVRLGRPEPVQGLVNEVPQWA